MTLSDDDKRLKWNFPSTGTGEEDGVNDSLMFYFAGDHEHSIARETIQNSIDAKVSPDTPVVVEFERFDMKRHDIPGQVYLLESLKKAWTLTKNQERADKFYEHAIEVLSQDRIAVLRVGDYNTTGLNGEDNDRHDGWYSLIRAKGASSQTGSGGGSFGIGKGAPYIASAVRTVFYSTVNQKGSVAFQGKARISSFEETPDDVRRGVGDFGEVTEKGVKSVRTNDLIPSAFQRTEQGTDIFIVGYETAEDDWRTRIIQSVLNNFWAAIHYGDLEVVIKEGGIAERISSESLYEYLKTYHKQSLDALYFYEAVIAPEYEKRVILPTVGEVYFVLKTGENYPKAVQMMRLPKMVVYPEGRYRVLPEPYAAVFMSIDEAGNRLIRELEPPAHDKWKQELDEVNGACTFKEVNDFVRDCLREFAQKPGADSQQFKGLNKYLGFSTERDDLNVGANRGEHDGHKKADVETAVEVGATTEHELATEISLPSAKKMVTVSSAARGDDTQRGGIVNRRNETHTDGASDTEEGKFPRMDMSAVEFYSVAKKTDSGYTYQITLSPSEDVDGAVQLLAIGDGANYSVKIASASLESGVSIKTSGSTLVGLALKAGTPTRYNITLEGGKRYTLGVEDNGR